MTSNERKIINFLLDANSSTHIRLIAKKINFSNDYTQSLCYSLARAGHINYFNGVATMKEVSEPVVVTANVTLLTDDHSFIKAEENKLADAPDEKLDKVLADLEPIPEKKSGGFARGFKKIVNWFAEEK